MIPVHERRILEAHVRGIKLRELAVAEAELNEYEIRELKELTLMRMKGIPLQYLVHNQEFYGREFYVNSAVLIPRPETEGLVEKVLKRLMAVAPKPQILDFGTGSGCIGITVALERHDAKVWGTEASNEAAEVAHENAKKYRVAGYDVITVSDPPLMLQYENLPRLDVIVSNPPYLDASDDIANDVLEYEPHEALFSTHENDPYFYYKFLAKLCSERLSDEGFGAFEIAANRGPQTAALFEELGFKAVIENDLTGRARYLFVGW